MQGVATHLKCMARKDTIETTEGRVWLPFFDSGDVSLWTPPGSRQADVVADLVSGRAAWKPQYRNWIVPAVHAEEVIAELKEL